mmetsp:Transcript_37688/g.55529  ORF Transcript_37688/g.55529 Transcript_37688/m.55529 type:complete len:252 (+) Transcript_37688:2693-3448(+)
MVKFPIALKVACCHTVSVQLDAIAFKSKSETDKATDSRNHTRRVTKEVKSSYSTVTLTSPPIDSVPANSVAQESTATFTMALLVDVHTASVETVLSVLPSAHLIDEEPEVGLFVVWQEGTNFVTTDTLSPSLTRRLTNSASSEVPEVDVAMYDRMPASTADSTAMIPRVLKSPAEKNFASLSFTILLLEVDTISSMKRVLNKAELEASKLVPNFNCNVAIKTFPVTSAASTLLSIDATRRVLFPSVDAEIP